jgi:hypothetical protein
MAAIAEQQTLSLIFQEKPRALLSNVVPEEAMETFPEDGARFFTQCVCAGERRHLATPTGLARMPSFPLWHIQLV